MGVRGGGGGPCRAEMGGGQGSGAYNLSITMKNRRMSDREDWEEQGVRWEAEREYGGEAVEWGRRSVRYGE